MRIWCAFCVLGCFHVCSGGYIILRYLYRNDSGTIQTLTILCFSVVRLLVRGRYECLNSTEKGFRV